MIKHKAFNVKSFILMLEIKCEHLSQRIQATLCFVKVK